MEGHFSLENDGGIVNNNVYFPFIPSFRARETRVESPCTEQILILNSRESANTTLRKPYIAFASAKISLVIPA